MRALLILLPALCLAADIEKDEAVERRLRFASGARQHLEVDNVNGRILVRGTSRGDVQLTAKIHWRAKSDADLERARKEITLDSVEDKDGVSIRVNGPFRCGDDCTSFKGFRHTGYDFRHDLELEVPHGAAVKLKTINGDLIRVENVTGPFDLSSINGRIEMQGAATGGKVYALNGAVNLAFAQNPTQPSHFHAFNGKLEVRFQPRLNANAQIKTFNGHAYTDFDTTALPAMPASAERKDGLWRYKTNQFQPLKIGNGGPELKFETFNGNIHILSLEKQNAR